MENEDLEIGMEGLNLSEEGTQYLINMPNEVLQRLTFTMPWQDGANSTEQDADGFDSPTSTTKYTREAVQNECWKKFLINPQISTAVRGQAGRMAGFGFECLSEIYEIQEEIENTELDPRNRLYNYWPKWVARSLVEGELFLIFTIHSDGFIEIDFLDPLNLRDKGDDNTSIIFHPNKPLFPLFYLIYDDNGQQIQQIPSIFVARYPDLIQVAANHPDYKRKFQQSVRSRKKIYKKFGGYYKFVVSWDRGFMTRRATSYLRTVLEWLNHYENLKKYEIDHKKSSGAYTWVFSFEDPRAFKLWLSLDDTERRKTGLMQKMTPGAKLFLPPGMNVEAKNPNLTTIKDQDTDILHMVGSGLNEPEDIMMGTSSQKIGTMKASRGPMADRISDEIAYFDRFLKYDFWASIFFLKSAIGKFPETFKIREAVGFDKNKAPIFKNVRKRPEQLIDISYPTSEALNFEDRAKGLLGVKHGPVAESLGIPNSEVAKRVGIGGYGRQRLRKATEDEKFPELVYNIDSEQIQENTENNPMEET